MPGLDWIPGVSQIKSTVQLICGDVEGASQTQANFLRECPAVSQVTSTVQLLAGDADGALETQKRCLGTLNNVANGIPVVGHVKGVIHHAVGDHEGGNHALNAATRSSVVLASGAAAGIASGGLAAIPAGIAAGSAYDLTESVITDTPTGVVAAIDNAVNNPSAGSIFDAGAVFVGDGLAGYSGGQIGKNVVTKMQVNKLDALRSAKADQLNGALDGGSSLTSGEALQLGKDINSLTSQIDTLQQTGPQYYHDVKTNQIVVESGKGVGTAPPPVSVINPTDFEPEKTSREKPSTSRRPPRNAYPTPRDAPTRPSGQIETEEGEGEEEDGRDYDYYRGDLTTAKLNLKELKETMREYEEQEAKPDRIPNVPFESDWDEMNLEDSGFTSSSGGGGDDEQEGGSESEGEEEESSSSTSESESDSDSDETLGSKTKTKTKKVASKKPPRVWNQSNPWKLDPADILSDFTNNWRYFFLQMPESVSFEAAIMVNHLTTGLLHSFIRHRDQWLDAVPGLERYNQRLPIEVGEHIDAISGDELSREEVDQLLTLLLDYLRNLFETDKVAFRKLYKLLLKIQRKIWQFLRTKIIYDNYLGEIITDKKQVLLCFKVIDANGNSQVLVLALPKVKYEERDATSGNVIFTFRSIITAYFISWEKFENVRACRIYDEDEEVWFDEEEEDD